MRDGLAADFDVGIRLKVRFESAEPETEFESTQKLVLLIQLDSKREGLSLDSGHEQEFCIAHLRLGLIESYGEARQQKQA